LDSSSRLLRYWHTSRIEWRRTPRKRGGSRVNDVEREREVVQKEVDASERRKRYRNNGRVPPGLTLSRFEWSRIVDRKGKGKLSSRFNIYLFPTGSTPLLRGCLTSHPSGQSSPLISQVRLPLTRVVYSELSLGTKTSLATQSYSSRLTFTSCRLHLLPHRPRRSNLASRKRKFRKLVENLLQLPPSTRISKHKRGTRQD